MAITPFLSLISREGNEDANLFGEHLYELGLEKQKEKMESEKTDLSTVGLRRHHETTSTDGGKGQMGKIVEIVVFGLRYALNLRSSHA